MMYSVPRSDWPKTVRDRMAYVNTRGVPTGPVPLGYHKGKHGGMTFVYIDEEAGWLVQEAFRLAAHNKLPLRQIIPALSELGLVSKRGTPLSATALWRILTNPFYCGTIRYAGKTLEGNHEPLVSKAEFSLVQARLAERRRSLDTTQQKRTLQRLPVYKA